MKAVAGGGAGHPRELPATTTGIQLYNLRQDSGEKESLAEKNPEKLRELTAAWEKLNRDMIAPLWLDGPAPRNKAGHVKKEAPPG